MIEETQKKNMRGNPDRKGKEREKEIVRSRSYTLFSLLLLIVNLLVQPNREESLEIALRKVREIY